MSHFCELSVIPELYFIVTSPTSCWPMALTLKAKSNAREVSSRGYTVFLWTGSRNSLHVCVTSIYIQIRANYNELLGQADVILANSNFTSRVFKAHFTSIAVTPQVVYPGVNLAAYEATSVDKSDPDIIQITS